MKRMVYGLMVFCWVMSSDVMGSVRTRPNTNKFWASSRNQISDPSLRALNGWWKNAVRAHQLTQKMVTRSEDPRIYAEISQNAYELLGLNRDGLLGQSYENAQKSVAKRYRQEMLKWHESQWTSASQEDRDYAANMSKSLNAANDLVKRELETSHLGSPYVLQGRNVEQEERERAWVEEQEHQRREQAERDRMWQRQPSETNQEFEDLFAHFVAKENGR